MTSPYSMLENFKARFICDDATGFLLLLFISIFKKIFYERSLPLQSCEGRSPTINGWGMFTIFLDYKLKEQGKPLIKIDKWFPSTKKCSSCGTEKSMPLSERTYRCSYGYVAERDHNSAINIKDEGILAI
ncbi:hypothetical protein AWH48_00575 [Domibacillus aminovorans]|uniref:Cas12f1-like TNB domain-containing protein n=1 Tax=Domibacillus aminovorans TaxID=29332 RepID=A0A177L2K8_9BACI|nr:hypothetical protein AWH48_00575 [Domibacillus aminovorans]